MVSGFQDTLYIWLKEDWSVCAYFVRIGDIGELLHLCMLGELPPICRIGYSVCIKSNCVTWKSCIEKKKLCFKLILQK